MFRTGKQARERYYSYLDPSLKKGGWTHQEDKLLMKIYKQVGKKWFHMTKYLNGRNENSIKSRFAVLCRNYAYDPNCEQDLSQVRSSRKLLNDEPD